MTSKQDEQRHFQEAGAPDAFDRAYGQAQGFVHSSISVVTESGVLGVGGVRQFTVQTFRVPEAGDQVFIWMNGPEGGQRVFLPAKVTNAIANQRDALTFKNRSAAGKLRAKQAKANGIVPGFMRKKK